MAISDRRARLGAVQLYIEPRDAWIGVYVAPDAVYVCPLPFIVIKLQRGPYGPRFVDQPASHAMAHAEGFPCSCYPQSRAAGSSASGGTAPYPGGETQ